MSPRRYTGEPEIDTDAQMHLPGTEGTTLAEAVANGRLFVLNGRGEFEQVVCASWFQTDYQKDREDLLTVWSTGVEINENGETTRRWR